MSLGGATHLCTQDWAKEWPLGCVNSPPTARGIQEVGLTQPRVHSLAHPCTSDGPMCVYRVGQPLGYSQFGWVHFDLKCSTQLLSHSRRFPIIRSCTGHRGRNYQIKVNPTLLCMYPRRWATLQCAHSSSHSPKEKTMAPTSDNHGRASNRTVSEKVILSQYRSNK